MEAAVAAGARVINLLVGDPRFPYRPPRPTPVAAFIDQSVHQHNLIVTVSTGNYLPWDDRTEELTESSNPGPDCHRKEKDIIRRCRPPLP